MDDYIPKAASLAQELLASPRRVPHRMYVTKQFLDALSRMALTPDAECKVNAFMGIPVYENNFLAVGVLALFVGKDYMPLGMIVDEAYTQSSP